MRWLRRNKTPRALSDYCGVRTAVERRLKDRTFQSRSAATRQEAWRIVREYQPEAHLRALDERVQRYAEHQQEFPKRHVSSVMSVGTFGRMILRVWLWFSLVWAFGWAQAVLERSGTSQPAAVCIVAVALPLLIGSVVSAGRFAFGATVAALEAVVAAALVCVR
jgi:hypothetical protein